MYKTNKILVLTAVAVGFIATHNVRADSASVPPRTGEVLSVFRTVSGSSEDKVQRSAMMMPPKMAEMQASLRTEPGSSSSVDLAHDSTYIAMGKHPIMNPQFQVAPVK